MIANIRDNPTEFHARYHVQKLVGPTDPSAEYFVLRLDINGGDIDHISACRAAINTYADKIEKTNPHLAHKLKFKYPLL